MARRMFSFGNSKRSGHHRHQGPEADSGISAERPPPPALFGDRALQAEPPAWQADPGASYAETEGYVQDDPQLWATIIVDEPIVDFEPKPPTAHSYRPDTIFDGWSTDYFTVRLASVRGYSHRYRGVPRQDDAVAAFHRESGTILFAVADGVSSASQSHLGATTACTTAVNVMRWQLESENRTIDLKHAAHLTAEGLTKQATQMLGQGKVTPAAVEGLLATTLVTGYIVPVPAGGTGRIIQIGDSAAWILENDRYFPILEQKNQHAHVISSAVSPLPRIPEHLSPVDFSLRPGAALVIGTDGFGDALGDGEGKIGYLFADNLRTPPPSRGLAHLLDFSRDTFDDDRSLIAIWPRPYEPAAPK
jgi:hypothetical protein